MSARFHRLSCEEFIGLLHKFPIPDQAVKPGAERASAPGGGAHFVVQQLPRIAL